MSENELEELRREVNRLRDEVTDLKHDLSHLRYHVIEDVRRDFENRISDVERIR